MRIPVALQFDFRDMLSHAGAEEIGEIFDMRPAAIEQRLKLRAPIYSATASYGHMGRTPEVKTVVFKNSGNEVSREIETFTWEKLDYVDKVKESFEI